MPVVMNVGRWKSNIKYISVGQKLTVNNNNESGEKLQIAITVDTCS